MGANAKEDTKTLALIVVAYVLLWPLSVLWDGYAIRVLWEWFMVPTLGLPALTLAQAIGINLAVCAIVARTWYAKDERGHAERLAAWISIWALRPLLLLGIGRIVRLFL